MPKRITNILRAGLPSKIYFLAYNGPKSGYEIASKIYGREKYPPTSKVYSWTKKIEGKELTKTEKGYISNVVPLLEEIEATFKKNHNIDLSDLDKHILRKILDSPEFRLFVENANCNLLLDQDIDSASMIMSTLGLLATAHMQTITLAKYFGKKIELVTEPKTNKEFDKSVEKIKSKLQEKYRQIEPESKKMMEDATKILDSFRKAMPEEALSVEARMKDRRSTPARSAYFFAMPAKLLTKLQKLYPPSEFMHSLMVNMLLLRKTKKWFKKKMRENRADNP